MANKFDAVGRANASRPEIPETELPFQSPHMFFYDSSMDLQILRIVAKLENFPMPRSGLVRESRIKMWSVFPVDIVHDVGVSQWRKMCAAQRNPHTCFVSRYTR